MSRTVLVVDDEPTISEAVAARLRGEGYQVVTAVDGPAAVEACARFDPDLVVLDLMLPGFDGLEVCRRIQASRPVPVLMLTAKSDETDMLVGLGVGADDYLGKPFSMRELVARVHALIRRAERSATAEPHSVRIGDLQIDHRERRVSNESGDIHLTRTEFDILAYLAARPRTAVSRETLLSQLWGWDDSASSRTVDSHVKALRRKLGGDLIRTVHGVGYAVESPR
ncbi:DNA-binding response regulator [Rhodococcus sp. 06-412-2C]|uniref:response regulator transcription factor n=1 Tax=unclassified Rhodococcus (in: high G+C Gram-positive bacteria) TaxID=192944 RepID=UPI000B9B1EF2|nr:MULTISPECIES: response regulator transcription factor [unclassified Rhodococcus (in: high G+C Gram-positive bacteria)]OZC86523.1 DNA-binding response regulator [Rhodococcus sp. 06-412-2C]OZD02222.1 DNA-binding response regulator [Rhodococcus sp. 06-412-2B]